MKIPSPHDLGLHKVLNPLRTIVNPIVEYGAKQRLRNAVNIADLRQCAKLRAHKMVFDYLDSGADDEIILRRAKDAYSDLEMHYHVLAGLQPPLDLSTKIFGQDVKLPFFGCPTAGNRMFHHEGESAAARAAQHHGSLYGLSSLATTGIEDIGKMCVCRARARIGRRACPRAFRAREHACVCSPHAPCPPRVHGTQAQRAKGVPAVRVEGPRAREGGDSEGEGGRLQRACAHRRLHVVWQPRAGHPQRCAAHAAARRARPTAAGVGAWARCVGRVSTCAGPRTVAHG